MNSLTVAVCSALAGIIGAGLSILKAHETESGWVFGLCYILAIICTTALFGGAAMTLVLLSQ